MANKNWITDLLKNKPEYGDIDISDWLLPGTHDTAAYTFDFSIKNLDLKDPEHLNAIKGPFSFISIPITRLWSQTQTLNITEQLNAGIRFFDLRVSIIDEVVYFSHSYVCEKASTLLDEIYNFSINNSSEIIILSIIPDPHVNRKPEDKDIIRSFLRSQNIFNLFYIPDQCPNFGPSFGGENITPNMMLGRGTPILTGTCGDPQCEYYLIPELCNILISANTAGTYGYDITPPEVTEAIDMSAVESDYTYVAAVIAETSKQVIQSLVSLICIIVFSLIIIILTVLSKFPTIVGITFLLLIVSIILYIIFPSSLIEYSEPMGPKIINMMDKNPDNIKKSISIIMDNPSQKSIDKVISMNDRKLSQKST